MARQQVLVVTLLDWSKSFTDPDGSFYCGSTDEQKENAARAAEIADIVIFGTDVHPIQSKEHAINGGLYPAHNAPKHWMYGKDFIYFIKDGKKIALGDRTLSPQLTEAINGRLAGRKACIIAPKGVYYQDGARKPWFTPKDIEDTFGLKIVSPLRFLDGDFTYVIAPKQYFDATRLDSDVILPKKSAVPLIPRTSFNVYSLLTMKYPADKFELVFANTGVVESICRLHSSCGLRQMFKQSRMINLSDATTPLFGVGLGFETARQSRDAAERVCRDVGIEYVSTMKFISEFKKPRAG